MNESLVVPKNMKCIGDVMTNLDGSIDVKKEGQLKDGKSIGYYPAMNFHGTVWYDKKAYKYRCLIMCYGHPQEIINGTSLKNIMSQACNKWGRS